MNLTKETIKTVVSKYEDGKLIEVKEETIVREFEAAPPVIYNPIDIIPGFNPAVMPYWTTIEPLPLTGGGTL